MCAMRGADGFSSFLFLFFRLFFPFLFFFFFFLFSHFSRSVFVPVCDILLLRFFLHVRRGGEAAEPQQKPIS